MSENYLYKNVNFFSFLQVTFAILLISVILVSTYSYIDSSNSAIQCYFEAKGTNIPQVNIFFQIRQCLPFRSKTQNELNIVRSANLFILRLLSIDIAGLWALLHCLNITQEQLGMSFCILELVSLNFYNFDMYLLSRTVILLDWTFKKWGHSNIAFQHC